MAMEIEPRKTALVLIDLQHGITAMPVQPHSAEAVVSAARSLAEKFREKGSPVAYVRVDLNNMLPLIVDVSHGDPNGGPLPAAASELVPEAGFREGDLAITKRHWGAFGETGLEKALREKGVETIVLAGLVTNFGVESTARQAVALGFQVIVIEDACSSIDAESHRFAMERILPSIGRVRKAAEIREALA